VVGLEFRVLGRVEVLREGVPVGLRGRRVLPLIAGLLLSSNRVVSVDTLAEIVWGPKSPASPQAGIHTAISRIRQRLGHDLIETVSSGYVMHVEADRLDLARFDRLLVAADQSPDRDAVTALEEALSLFTAPLLGNVDSPVLHTEVVPVLTEKYLAARERWAELCLRLGQNEAVAIELSKALHFHPFRERFVGQLMLALFRSGRRAEALAAFEALRLRLAEEFGADPGAEVQGLHLEILRAESEPVPSAHAGVSPVPRQLPRNVMDFAGRVVETTLVADLLTSDPELSPLVVIAGQGGIGKTTLALHVAHGLCPAFPGGQLYVDLRGAGDHPSEAGEVLAGFLRSFGVASAAIPEAMDERAAMYRSLTADRRVLILLDNVACEDQVRLLLPGNAACGVIITSRTRLTGLADTHLVELDVLDEGTAATFLEHTVGAERLAAEPDETSALIRLCGGLPLALRIVGARLAAKRHWKLQRLVDRLGDVRGRLDELTFNDLDVRTSMTLSYQGLPRPAKAMLRRLALLDAPTIPSWAGAALMDVGIAAAGELMEELVDAQLLDVVEVEATGELRYRCHDLIRLYSRELAVAEEPAVERDAALARAFGAWLALARRAHVESYGGDFTVLHGGAERRPPDDPAVQWMITKDPLVWLDAERAAICTVVRQAAAQGLDELCWDLAWTATTLFEVRGYFDDWHTTQDHALQAVRRAGNRRGEAATLTSLSSWLIFQQSYPEARAAGEEAIRLFAEVDDRYGHGLAERNVGLCDTMAGRPDLALHHYAQARQDLRDTRDLYMELTILRGMGEAYLELLDHDTAWRFLQEALTIAQNTDAVRSEAQIFRALGEIHLRQSHFQEAQDSFEKVLRFTDNYDRVGEIYGLIGLGEAQRGQGRLRRAESSLLLALASARRLRQPFLEARAMLHLGELSATQGRPDTATDYLHQSLAGFRRLAMPLWEARVNEALDLIAGG
jgi:DNA-binding SARP family transcriptional activator/tetratricopeptide (TPR) repeat protein